MAVWPRPLQWVLPSWQCDPLGLYLASCRGSPCAPPILPVFPADVLLARLGHRVQGVQEDRPVVLARCVLTGEVTRKRGSHI